jgi:hypothetical protein
MRFAAPKATDAYFRKFHDPRFRLDCAPVSKRTVPNQPRSLKLE